MGHKRRKLKHEWVDPAVLKWRAAKREYDRRSRAEVERGAVRAWVLFKVAGWALLAAFEGLVARPGERRTGSRGYRRDWRFDAVGLGVLVVLAAGVGRAWVVGVAAAVGVVCLAGSAYVVRRMNRRLERLEGELAGAKAQKAAAVGEEAGQRRRGNSSR